ncbi:PREDICTED: uncharacterized protein LOC109485226 [Branchiostoma belcheri]|uniref:Uncharacterized protein LOC109485226 n=1 Tax=Branchiostoma belcheri TaxID=7741 RepID=A0A6P5AMF1_BRABE|nr:PREDICTED: uncharacterized protein LOC109485226 [Branchiostoma belcheri]
MAAVAFPTTPVLTTPPYVGPYTGLAHYSLISLLPSGVVNFKVKVTCVEFQELEVDFSITIGPPADPIEVWAPPLLDGPDSAFSKNLDRGNKIGAAALATSIAAVAVNIGKGNNGQGGGVGPGIKDKLKQLLEKVITKLDNIDTSNDYDVQLATLRALAVATSVGDLLTPLAMVSASNKTHFVVKDLHDRVAAGTPTVLSADEVDVACGAAFTTIAGALKPAAEAAREDHNNGLVYSDVLVANQLVATSSFRTIDVMDDIYLNYMMTAPDITGPPWPPALIVIKGLGLRIQREECGDATNRAYKTGEFSPIILGVPSSADVTDGCDGSAVSGMSITHAEFNPFEYSNNSYQVRGTVVGLASKIGNATNHVTGLGPPVDVIIRRRLMEANDMFSWDITCAYIGNVTVVPFLVRYNGSSLHINIKHNYTDPPPVVNLFLRKDAPPTPEAYNWTVSLPTPQADLFTIPAGNDTVTASPYSWLLEPPEIDITEDDVVNKTYYFLGIQFVDGEDAVTPLNFSVCVMETMCVYFGDEWENEEDHLWHGQGCKPGALSNSTHIHCRCNHLTKFTGLVAPNPINFSEVFTKDILQNPIGLILVLSTFLLYLLLVLWSRRKDRHDLAKVGVAAPQGHILNPDPWCQYVVTLYTGFKGGSWTTATVWINLFGDYGRTGPIALQDENRPLFEEGSVDSFLVSSQNIIGMIHVVHIWHDNTGYSPEWFLGQVVLQEKATGRVVYFLCNRWLAVGEDDGKIERLLPVSSPEELAEFGNLVKAKVERDMNDGHLWFSVKGRPARSPFTRVQRLSCCLTLLYSTMVTNIMFFGQGDNYDSPETIKIGETEFNVPMDLPKSPVIDENPEPRPLDTDEEYLQYKRKLQQPKVTMPLNTADLAAERSRKLDDKKRRSAVIEVCFFAIFTLVVMMNVYNEIDPLAFYMNESVKNSLRYETEEITFDEISDIESFWVWLQAGILPTLYYSSWYNNMADHEWVIMGNKNSWLVGSPTIRQARLDPVFPTFGEHGIYTEGGYSTTLNLTQSQLLQESGWLDENSRAVMVETILYNPNANLFSVVTFLVEFTYYGNAFPSVSISTLRLFQTSQILLIAMKGIMVLFLLIFVYKEGKLLVAQPVGYLQDVWNWVELLVILAGFSTLAVYFQTKSVIDQVSEPGSHTQFSVYRRAAGWVEVYTYVTAALICCVTLKLVRLIRFNKVVQVLFLTIRTSFKPLSAFMLMAGIVMMAFTQMGSLLFGANLQTYSSIGSSLASICLMTIGSFDTAELTEVSWIYGPIFFFLFQVTMQFFLMTMFMAILMDTYADVDENTDAQKLRMMAYMHGIIITKKRKMQQTVKNKRKPRDARFEIHLVNLRGDLSVYSKTFDHTSNALEYGPNDSQIDV